MPAGYKGSRVDVTLTNFVRNYKFERQTKAGLTVAPKQSVTSSVGRYKARGQELYDIHVSDTGGERSKANEIGSVVTEVTYETFPYALGWFVTEKEQLQAPPALNPKKHAALSIRHALELRHEDRVVTLAAATGNTGAIAPDWDDGAATIVADVNGAKATFKGNLGFPPTHWLFGDHVGDEIVGQADIVDLIKYAAAMQKPTAILSALTADELPNRMMGMNVLMPTARRNTAEPGIARVIANIWGDDSYVINIDPSPQSNTWAVTIEVANFVIRLVTSENPRGTWVIGYWDYVVKEITAEGIYRMSDVT